MVTTNGTAHSTTTVDGVVGARNERGLRLHGEADWRNLSKWAEPAPSIPNVGLPVRLTLDRSGFVRSIETRSQGDGAPPTVQCSDSSAEPGREMQIRRMAVLNTATAVLASRGVVDDNTLLTLAEKLERWVLR